MSFLVQAVEFIFHQLEFRGYVTAIPRGEVGIVTVCVSPSMFIFIFTFYKLVVHGLFVLALHQAFIQYGLICVPQYLAWMFVDFLAGYFITWEILTYFLLE